MKRKESMKRKNPRDVVVADVKRLRAEVRESGGRLKKRLRRIERMLGLKK